MLNVDVGPLRKSFKNLQTASAKLDAQKHELAARLESNGDHCKKRTFAKLRRFVKRIFGVHEGMHRPNGALFPHHGKGPHHHSTCFMRNLRAIRKLNHKLVAFERGFISPEGITDREWYKHLGVSPGKWLGYGATTLPALTEAITIERNATLAQHEVSRLADLIEALTSKLAS